MAATWLRGQAETHSTLIPELVRTLDETERATRDGLGIDTIRADDRLSSVTLAERAARRAALEQAGLDARDLGALVMVESRVQETFLSSEVTRLQRRLGSTCRGRRNADGCGRGSGGNPVRFPPALVLDQTMARSACGGAVNGDEAA
jgi:hypothetical protein